jgi:hypothetical protein
MIRMLVAGGDTDRRLRIAAAIEQRGPVRIELASSFETRLILLEWRNYELLGAFHHQGLAGCFAAACGLLDIQTQLVVFGCERREERTALRSDLAKMNLPPPILVSNQADHDPAAFWRSLVSSMIVDPSQRPPSESPHQAVRIGTSELKPCSGY